MAEQMIHQMTQIHPDARMGNNVTIEAFTAISGDVQIGDGTWIGPNVTIMDGARIGKNCKVFPGAVISAIPQDMKYKGEETFVYIGDGTTVRECVTINKGTETKGKTIVGENCLLMAYSHVAHDCVLGNNIIIGNNTALAGEVVIDDFVILSGIIGVHQFVRIGAHAFVQGGAMVGMDVPPFVIAGRNPTKYAGVNSIGMRRRGFTTENIRSIQDAYRLIYNSGLNNSSALERIQAELEVDENLNLILDFIKVSQRGIISRNAN